jgi:hypothetical protein
MLICVPVPVPVLVFFLIGMQRFRENKMKSSRRYIQVENNVCTPIPVALLVSSLR